MKSNFQKRLIPLLCCLALVVCLFPVGVSAAEIMYYNGNPHPPLPDWNKNEYPYVFIYEQPISGFYATSTPATVDSNGNAVCVGGYLYTCHSYENYEDRVLEDWISNPPLLFEKELCLNASHISWANYDILNSDGTLYLAGTEPSSTISNIPEYGILSFTDCVSTVNKCNDSFLKSYSYRPLGHNAIWAYSNYVSYDTDTEYFDSRYSIIVSPSGWNKISIPDDMTSDSLLLQMSFALESESLSDLEYKCYYQFYDAAGNTYGFTEEYYDVACSSDASVYQYSTSIVVPDDAEYLYFGSTLYPTDSVRVYCQDTGFVLTYYATEQEVTTDADKIIDGGVDPGSAELNDNIQSGAEDMENAMGEADQVILPTEEIQTDIDDLVDTESSNSVAEFLGRITGNTLVTTQFVISVVLTYGSYLLFGKKE